MAPGGLVVEVAGVEVLLDWRKANEEDKLLFWREEPGQHSVVPSLD